MGPGAAAASVEGGAARRSGRLQQVQQQEHQLPASTSAHPLNKRRRNVADPQLVAASNHDTQEGKIILDVCIAWSIMCSRM